MSIAAHLHEGTKSTLEASFARDSRWPEPAPLVREPADCERQTFPKRDEEVQNHDLASRANRRQRFRLRRQHVANVVGGIMHRRDSPGEDGVVVQPDRRASPALVNAPSIGR